MKMLRFVLFFTGPLKMYGEGIYKLSDVKEINGTKKYYQAAQKDGKCQEESYESCLARHYLAKGMEKCSCIPYKLRNYTNNVSTTV